MMKKGVTQGENGNSPPRAHLSRLSSPLLAPAAVQYIVVIFIRAEGLIALFTLLIIRPSWLLPNKRILPSLSLPLSIIPTRHTGPLSNPCE